MIFLALTGSSAEASGPETKGRGFSSTRENREGGENERTSFSSAMDHDCRDREINIMRINERWWFRLTLRSLAFEECLYSVMVKQVKMGELGRASEPQAQDCQKGQDESGPSVKMGQERNRPSKSCS